MVKNNPVLGYVICSGCDGRASVHAAARRGHHLYTRCTECGTDQRAGAKVQAKLWAATEWLPGLKPACEPAGVTVVADDAAAQSAATVQASAADDQIDWADGDKPAASSTVTDDDAVSARADDDDDKSGLAWLLGGVLALVALACGRV